MSAAATVTAFEFNLITEDEAIEQAMVDSLNDLYRKAIFELAPHLATRTAEVQAIGRSRASLSKSDPPAHIH